MKEELTIRKDRVLDAAETCSESKGILKRLFPEAFENDKLNHKVRVGDIFLDKVNNTYCPVMNCGSSMEIISVRDCNRLININLWEQPLTRSDVINRLYGCYEYIGNIYEDNLNINVKITPKE